MNEKVLRAEKSAADAQGQPRPGRRHVENLVIGAGLVGTITAWILARQGYNGVMLEKGDTPGGVNGSFRDALGNVFDHGRHVIDAHRNPFAANFFAASLGGRVRRFALETGLCLRGQLLPHAAPLEAWPEPLRSQIRIDESAPKVAPGSSRAAFARAYGNWFADLMFTEMLDAFPTLRWRRDHGAPEEQLLDWIFPWFAPVSGVEARPDAGSEKGVHSHESRSYHYSRRHAQPPRAEVLYPLENGFGGWIEAMLAQCTGHVELRGAIRDLRFDFDKTSLRLNSVCADGVEYTAERIFWCVPLPVLCRLLDWPLPAGVPQGDCLGSFAFRDPVNVAWHDILFADPRHLIKRVNFPERIAGKEDCRTLQVEFTMPAGEHKLEPEEWRNRWLASLRETGIVAPDNEPLGFDFRHISRGIVTSADVNAFVEEARARLAGSQTNLVAPRLSAASDNNSRLVPEVFRRVFEVLLA